MRTRPSYALRTLAAGVLLLASALGAEASAVQSMTDIIVTTVSDETNGNTSSVTALLSNPGPDGISLREAILATNNNPGTYTIRFASTLRGVTILVNAQLPPLTGGGVTIEGDIDGDGKPDVTIGKSTSFFWYGNCPSSDGCGLSIASSKNQLHALTLVGFGAGVDIAPRQPSMNVMATHQTLSDNVVSGLVMHDIKQFGVIIGSMQGLNCGVRAGFFKPCWTFNTWTNTTITGNTIQVLETGISVKPAAAGDRFENTTVTDNNIQINGHDAGISFCTGGNGTETIISGGLIARNTITGRTDIGIGLVAGCERAEKTIVENVRILDNQVNLVSHDSDFCCQGIIIQAGTDAPWAIFPDVLPLGYPDGNQTRNILVSGNTISGTLVWGVSLASGMGSGGSFNSVHDIQFKSNTITSDTQANAVLIWTAGGHPTFGNRLATGNQIAHVTLDSNRITVGGAKGSGPLEGPGAIRIVGGAGIGRNGSVKDIQILNNVVTAADDVLELVGGIGDSQGNQIAGVQIINNTFAETGNSSLRITSNVKGATNNTISDVTISNTIFVGKILGEVTASMIRSSIVTQGNSAAANGTIRADPKFIDPTHGDFHLRSDSPAIDAGTSSGAPTVDFDGRPRSNGNIDIGAYEFAGTRPRPTTPSPSSTVVRTAAKTTITCVKGRLIKKIKAIKPRCPIGYREK